MKIYQKPLQFLELLYSILNDCLYCQKQTTKIFCFLIDMEYSDTIKDFFVLTFYHVKC